MNLPDRPPDAAAKAAEEFIERYGVLNRDPSIDTQFLHAIRYSRMFRLARPGPESNTQRVNEFLDAIFAAAWTFDRGEHPAIRADFATGEWRPEPRTLLDVLAITF